MPVYLRAAAIFTAFLLGLYMLALLRCGCGWLSVSAAWQQILPEGSFVYFWVIPFAVMVVELLCVGWKDSSLAQLVGASTSVRRDFFYGILQFTPLTALIAASVSAGLFDFLRHYAQAYSLGLGVHANPVVQVAVIFVVTDFVAYWGHRWTHSIPTLWEAHKVHHSATNFNVLLTFRFHPVERIWNDVIAIPTALVLGADTSSFVLFNLINIVLGQVQHMRVNWTYGPVGWLIISPAFHRLHHAIDKEHHDKNFGGRLTIWDRMFGTYSPKLIGVDEVGVEDNTYENNHVVKEFFRPFYRLGVDLWAAAGAARRRLSRARPDIGVSQPSHPA